ncbi:hypothetical protein GCM10009854_23990 [Saccharopolyspora halophila]|uniref:Solute-binding protein family 5 domain-containing protein n=1 Tax=Saccharopolyspora halophila TaxID=405551 RepID=A0ABN3G8B6_9PSEU
MRAAFSGGGSAETLDPHETDLYIEIARAKALFDKLADYGSDMSPQPRPAERWESSTDLRTWRITLRQANFHDGRPVRAADVLASYARITEPLYAAPEFAMPILLVAVFAVQLGWFPPTAIGGSLPIDPALLVLPITVLLLRPICSLSRLVRAG